MTSHVGILALTHTRRERPSIRMIMRLDGNPPVEILGSRLVLSIEMVQEESFPW